MSDGITDSRRDQKRGERYEDFLEVLADFLLEQPSQEGYKLLERAAASVDGVPRGLMSGRTSLSAGLAVMVNELRIGNEKTWAKLLLSAAGGYPTKTFKRLKEISPFRDRILISVDYGLGFVHIGGELESFLANFIGNVNGLKTYNADSYLVAIGKIDRGVLENAKLVWLGCGISGIKGPRSAKESSYQISDDD